jgi:hypothetical protein
MRKFSSLFRLLTVSASVFLVFAPLAVTGKKSLKEKIISKRIENEKAEIEYSVKVANQEHEIVKKLALNALLKKKKLRFLIKSSKHMKDNCIPFDY